MDKFQTPKGTSTPLRDVCVQYVKKSPPPPPEICSGGEMRPDKPQKAHSHPQVDVCVQNERNPAPWLSEICSGNEMRRGGRTA